MTLSERFWPLVLVLDILLLVLNFWGPPVWLDQFPQTYVQRFLSALFCNALTLMLTLGVRVFAFPPQFKKIGQAVFDGVALVLVFAFCGIIFLKKPIENIDLLLTIAAGLSFCLLSFAAFFSLKKPPQNGRKKFSALITALAAPYFFLALLFHFFIPFTRLIFLLIAILFLLFLLILHFGQRVEKKTALKIPSQKLSSQNVTGQSVAGLSPRELEVLRLIGQGLTNHEIAASLFISLPTVKTHLSHIFEKTGTRNRLEAARIILLADTGSDFQPIESMREKDSQ